jgi:hypothetical protein
MMIGELKSGPFYIGHRRPFSLPSGATVNITEEQNHPIYGKRYKVSGYEDWFEANCFEYVM